MKVRLKITPSVLSISPYFSTTWKNVSSLHTREGKEDVTLVITLDKGASFEVPGLDEQTVQAIFSAHAKYAGEQPSTSQGGTFGFPLPIQANGEIPIEAFGLSMQHNPDQMDLPSLPPEVLEKVTQVAQKLGLDDLSVLPDPEEGCNCFFCQVVRAFQKGSEDKDLEEVITEEDLRFRNWEIEQTAEKLYQVTNPLDSNEHYNVFLGDPLGCTCGQKNCEHIQAVLKT